LPSHAAWAIGDIVDVSEAWEASTEHQRDPAIAARRKKGHSTSAHPSKKQKGRQQKAKGGGRHRITAAVIGDARRRIAQRKRDGCEYANDYTE
jgi:hypothetical protein